MAKFFIREVVESLYDFEKKGAEHSEATKDIFVVEEITELRQGDADVTYADFCLCWIRIIENRGLYNKTEVRYLSSLKYFTTVGNDNGCLIRLYSGVL